jgi:hypothetical protein
LLVLVALGFSLACATRASATNLIVNGSFEQPTLTGSYAFYTNGTVPGWTTTDSGKVVEIDGDIFGASAYAGSQSLEVNANGPEDVMQTVTGLTVGQQYILSWAYGDRPSSGPQEMQVYFSAVLNKTLIATDTDTATTDTNTALVWYPQSYTVTATSATEILSFEGISEGGQTSFGNEIDAVSLVPVPARTPEPSSLVLLASGLGLLGYAAWRRQTAAARL